MTGTAAEGKKLVLVTGGARSGKSGFAERLFMKRIPDGGIYVATAEAHDDEMRERIRRHQSDREQSGYGWKTVNEPLRLPEWLARTSLDTEAADEGPAVLIDCLTLWLSNELLQAERQWGEGPEAERYLEGRIERLAEEAGRFRGTLVMVTNEVGDSIVPVYKLGRMFRDAAGRLNQRIAGKADEVYLVTAGIPIELKSREVQL